MTTSLFVSHDPILNLLTFLAFAGVVSMITLARRLVIDWSAFARAARQPRPVYRQRVNPARFARG